MFQDHRQEEYTLPALHHDKLENAFDEIELLGFPLSNPFDLLEEAELPDLRSAELEYHVNEVVTITGYLVSIKNTRTNSKKRMHFGTFLDYDGKFIDTVHFPPSVSQYPFTGKGVYRLKGKVVEEFGFYSIEVDEMERLAMVPDPRYA